MTQCKGNTIVMLSKPNYALSLLWNPLHQIVCIKTIVPCKAHPSFRKNSPPVCFHFPRYFSHFLFDMLLPALFRSKAKIHNPFSHSPKSSDLFMISTLF